MHICERKRGAQSWGDILFLTGLYEVDTGWSQVVPGITRLVGNNRVYRRYGVG